MGSRVRVGRRELGFLLPSEAREIRPEGEVERKTENIEEKKFQVIAIITTEYLHVPSLLSECDLS